MSENTTITIHERFKNFLLQEKHFAEAAKNTPKQERTSI